MNEKLYLLWFVQEHDDRDDTELLIGVFASEADANRAIEQLKSKPGFSAHHDGFQIHAYQLGQIGWAEGFVEESTSSPS